jgi:hypothetical protein
MRNFKLVLTLISVVVFSATTTNAASITNGSFETGDFFGWTPTDIAVPFDVQGVLLGGTITLFDGFLGPNVVIPSDGIFAQSNGFDGGGPDTISLAQDIGVIAPGELLEFDYRAGWDLIGFSFPGALDRLFEVFIEPAGGGIPLGSSLILTAPIGTDTFGGPNSDTGPLSGAIDLSPFAGTDARVNFVWSVPDDFTGPANAQLDNVTITIIPEPTTLTLAALALLGMSYRRRKQA